jgi:hypothetical protein
MTKTDMKKYFAFAAQSICANQTHTIVGEWMEQKKKVFPAEKNS